MVLGQFFFGYVSLWETRAGGQENRKVKKIKIGKNIRKLRARDAGGGLWRPSRVSRRMHATNSLTVRRDGSMTSAIALHHELRLPLLLGLLDNQSHNHEQMDVFHLLLG